MKVGIITLLIARSPLLLTDDSDSSQITAPYATLVYTRHQQHDGVQRRLKPGARSHILPVNVVGALSRFDPTRSK